MTTVLAITTGVLILVVVYQWIDRSIERVTNNVLARKLNESEARSEKLHAQIDAMNKALEAAPNAGPLGPLRDLRDVLKVIGAMW